MYVSYQIRISRRSGTHERSPTRACQTLGSLVEEPERLSISCEFVECVSSSFKIGTEIRQGVLSANAAMPARALRATMRQCTGVEKPDQRRPGHTKQHRRLFRCQLIRRRLKLGDRILERLNHFWGKRQVATTPVDQLRTRGQRRSELVQSRQV